MESDIADSKKNLRPTFLQLESWGVSTAQNGMTNRRLRTSMNAAPNLCAASSETGDIWATLRCVRPGEDALSSSLPTVLAVLWSSRPWSPLSASRNRATMPTPR